jgi:GTP pyrophosphokinase
MRRDERFYDTRLGDALHLAAESFAHVERKGSGIPYLSHLLAVTTIVMEHGGTPDQCIAAVLHDYIEDIDGASPDELTARFGANVTQLVLALSDTTRDELDADGKKPPWEQRKQRYLAHLEHATPEVKLISAADKLHNASSIVRDRERIGDAIYERFTPTREQTLWYYRSVVDALGSGWDHALLDELRRVVDALHAP